MCERADKRTLGRHNMQYPDGVTGARVQRNEVGN